MNFRDPSLREHFVYRAYNAAGQLLYVGCTMNLKSRLAGHRADRKVWLPEVVRWKLQGPFNYDTAREMERIALRDEYPLHGMTPQRHSARRRELAWLNRRTLELLAELGIKNPTAAQMYAAWDAASSESSRIDFAAQAEAKIAERRAGVTTSMVTNTRRAEAA